MDFLSTSDAAQILGVSGATVRNWCKAGHLLAAQAKPLLFSTVSVHSLRERIKSNRFNRLRKRANKTAADSTPVPATTPELTAFLAILSANAAAENIRSEQIVYCAAMVLLGATDEVGLGRQPVHLLVPDALRWRRSSIAAIMKQWHRRLARPFHPYAADNLDQLPKLAASEDILGVVHQSLSTVGKKSRNGSYLTPYNIIDQSLAELGIRPRTFLDPCCGTGRYLLRAVRLFSIDPHRLYGFDVDPAAVDIASINLLLDNPDWNFIPRIRCLNSLTDLANGQPECDTNNLLNTIDAIATNPPWGSNHHNATGSRRNTRLKSNESFSLFLEKSLTLLRPGGRMSFVLPESMLKIKAHAGIRRLLLEQTKITKITLMGRAFSGIFTSIMRLDAEKSPPPPLWNIHIARNGTAHQAAQQRFAANSSSVFDVAVTPGDEKLLEKIFSVPYQTLSGQAEWAMGIVTGDNNGSVLQRREADAEPVLRGRDVFKYAPRAPRCFIRFQPSRFQQVAPERMYRAPEKLIYRFVSDRLVFAYDNQQILTLNSANILIPRMPAMSIKAALAFLNSQVFHYVFVKRFRTRKILRGDLETLPFLLLEPQRIRALEQQVDLCMTGDYQHADSLDMMINTVFGLNGNDVAEMRASLETESSMLII